MKYSTRLSDAIHILVLIEINELGSLSSAAIANSIRTNPGFVRQLMMALRKGQILNSVQGHAKPSLTRSPEKITILDIYKAVEGDKPLLHMDTHTNPECGTGINIQLSLQHFYDEIQKATENHMAQITLHDIIMRYRELLSNTHDFCEAMSKMYD